LYEIPSYVPYVHPQYNVGGFAYNDIALLKISQYSKYPPVRLQTPALSSLTAPGNAVTVSGWGATVRVLWEARVVAVDPVGLHLHLPCLLACFFCRCDRQQAGGFISPYLRWTDLTVKPDSVCAGLFPDYDPATQVG
jgi:hypothetical protein